MNNAVGWAFILGGIVAVLLVVAMWRRQHRVHRNDRQFWLDLQRGGPARPDPGPASYHAADDGRASSVTVEDVRRRMRAASPEDTAPLPSDWRIRRPGHAVAQPPACS